MRHLPSCDQSSGGENIEEAEEWRKSQRAVTVKDDPTNDFSAECYALDLGVKLKNIELWVRQDYIRIYIYCSKWNEEGLSFANRDSMVCCHFWTTRNGVFLSSAASCALSNNPLCEKVKHIEALMPSVVVLVKKKPFLLVFKWPCFLFIKDGVFKQDVERVGAHEFMPFLRAFIEVDSNSVDQVERGYGRGEGRREDM